jgi:hypothetical protein
MAQLAKLKENFLKCVEIENFEVKTFPSPYQKWSG